jgi:hypothetical protein
MFSEISENKGCENGGFCYTFEIGGTFFSRIKHTIMQMASKLFLQ